MKLWALGKRASSTLLAAAITGGYLLPALLIAGVLGLIVMIFFLYFNKSGTPSLSSATRNKKKDFKLQSEISPNSNISADKSETPAAVPKLERKPGCNLRFKDARVGEKKPDVVASPSSARIHRELYLGARFANEGVQETELRPSTLHACATYRNSNGDEILKATNVPWALGTGTAHTTLPANTSNYLVLFILTLEGKLICRTIGDLDMRIPVRMPQWLDYEFHEPIAKVEVQLLANSECLYTVLLDFQHDVLNSLPQLNGFRELQIPSEQF